MTPNGFSGDDISNVSQNNERMARQKMRKGENGLQMPLGIFFLTKWIRSSVCQTQTVMVKTAMPL